MLELIAEVERLRAEVKEWLCIDCNTVYPGPPQPGLSCGICPKCGGSTGPRPAGENRLLRAELARDQSGTKTPETRMDAAFEGGPNGAAPAAGTVEIDERHEFERHMSQRGDAAHYIGDGMYSTGAVQDQWEAWLARAAIEAHTKTAQEDV